MAVFKALAGRLEERFNKLGFSQLAKETKSVAADVFVRMLQVQADTIAKRKLAFYLGVAHSVFIVPNQDPLLPKFPAVVELWTDLIV